MDQQQTLDDFKAGLKSFHQYTIEFSKKDVRFKSISDDFCTIMAKIDTQLAMQMRGYASGNAPLVKPSFGTTPPNRSSTAKGRHRFDRKKVVPLVNVSTKEQEVEDNTLGADEDPIENGIGVGVGVVTGNDDPIIGEGDPIEGDPIEGEIKEIPPSEPLEGEPIIPVKDQKTIAAAENSGTLKTVNGDLIEGWAEITPQTLSSSMNKDQLISILKTLLPETEEGNMNKMQLSAAIILESKKRV